MQKKVAIVQDVSCMGKCSTLVAAPIISGFSHEVHLLPTAIFSAHTGFENHHHIDLTEFMSTVLSDWKKENLSFDGIYSGYILNAEQIKNTKTLIKDFAKTDSVILVDPVIGDGGEAYSFLSEKIRDGMIELVKMADVITPNLTEVAILLGKDMLIEGYDESYISNCLREFEKMGCKNPVITGVQLKAGEIGAAYLFNGEIHFCFSQEYSGKFSGTGDTFASVLFSALVKGIDFHTAIRLSIDILDVSLKDNDKWYGVDFEKALKIALD
ncbi:MAG: PfkB family carbohydrate kinase [Clostridia bacterium]